MKKKTFASLFLSGKLAAGLLASKAKALSLEDFFSQDLHLSGVPSQAVEVYPGDTYGSAQEVVVKIPGANCTYQAPHKLQVVLTGLRPGEEVFLGIASSLDDPQILAMTQNKVHLGSDLRLLSYFSVIAVKDQNPFPTTLPFGVDLGDSQASVVVSIELPEDLSSLEGEEFYLQAVAFPQGQIDWSLARATEVMSITAVEESCY